MDPVRAFTIGDRDFFLGVVALLNSLRLTGNELPLTVLDLGFLSWQRDLLEPFCEVVDPAERDVLPVLMKTFAPSRSSADVIVLIDADVIVTGSLQPVIDAATRGLVYGFVDGPASRRCFAEWTDLFALQAPLRRQPYVNAGFVAVSRRWHPGLLGRWEGCCHALRGRKVLSDTVESDPVWLPDQDALNALLMSEVPSERVAFGMVPGMVLGPDALRAAQVVDLDALECRLGTEPVALLHSVGTPKPWQPDARWNYRVNAYTRCLSRVLSANDVALRVPDEHIPRWLRSDLGARLSERAMQAYDRPARRTRAWRRRVGLSPIRGRGDWRSQE